MALNRIGEIIYPFHKKIEAAEATVATDKMLVAVALDAATASSFLLFSMQSELSWRRLPALELAKQAW